MGNVKNQSEGLFGGCDCSVSSLPFDAIRLLKLMNSRRNTDSARVEYLDQRKTEDHFPVLIEAKLCGVILNAAENYQKRKKNAAAKDICVMHVDFKSIFVQSKSGIVLYEKSSGCPKCWVISDVYIVCTSGSFSVSELFDIVYDRVDDPQIILETLSRLILHTVAITDCTAGQNACYSTFVKRSSEYHIQPFVISEERSFPNIFPFDLDFPVSLSVILQIFRVGLDGDYPFLRSKNLKVPFSFSDGFLHIGVGAKLSQSAMSIITKFKDDVLVGKRSEACIRSEPVIRKNDPIGIKAHYSNDVGGKGRTGEMCIYFHSLGLRNSGTCQHYFYGVDEIAAQFQKMGVPGGIMFHILATKFARQESDVLTATCDNIALEVAECIRSLKSTFDRPIVLESERKGFLSRLSMNKTVFLLNRRRKMALRTLRKNITVAGQLELNAGVLKVAMCAQEREKLIRRAPESLKLSEYVCAIANRELVNSIVNLGDNLKADVWVDPDDSPAFNAACLIALWTMD